MANVFARLATAVFLFAATAQAAAPALISTHCREIEVPLDAYHSAARLAGCGGTFADDLLWHLDRIDQIAGDLDGTFDRRSRGAGSVVYVMDTGVMAQHSEFSTSRGVSRVIAGFDTTSSVTIGISACRSANKATAPCYANYEELVAASHGTSVASIVAGSNIGVAPEALIVSVRVMNERGLATTRTYVEGLDNIIRHAWSSGAPPFQTGVINISGWVLERLSSESASSPVVPYSTLERKMADMTAGVGSDGRPDPNGKRFLFVVAGNNVDGGCGRSGVVDRFPAIVGPDVDGVITVGGMTADNSWWTGACKGNLEVLAPAQGIFSASITATDHYRGRKPNLRSGTSFAAPVISGIAARMLGERPGLTPQQLEAMITSTPSRIDNPIPPYANGKVGYVNAVPSASARLDR